MNYRIIDYTVNTGKARKFRTLDGAVKAAQKAANRTRDFVTVQEENGGEWKSIKHVSSKEGK
jgi:hypothetical protein